MSGGCSDCVKKCRPLYRPNILSFFHFFLFLILNILKLSLMDSTKQDFFLCFISFKYLPLLLLYTYTLLIIHFLVIIIFFYLSEGLPDLPETSLIRSLCGFLCSLPCVKIKSNQIPGGAFMMGYRLLITQTTQ